MKCRVLTISDDQEYTGKLCSLLQDEEINICWERFYESAYPRFVSMSYTLVILDIHTTDSNDGITMLECFHRQNPVPTVILSYRPSAGEALQVLSSGADQYWPKAAEIDIVISHIKALLRRQILNSVPNGERHRIISFENGLTINHFSKTAYINGEKLKLQPKQFAILACLSMQIGQMVTKEQLYGSVWKDNYDISCDETLKYHISKIREEFRSHGVDGIIQIFWGVGYGLNDGPL